MRRERKNHLALLGASLFTFLLFTGSTVVPSTDNTLTEEQKKGKQIYLKGESPSGDDIIAVMSGVDVPAAVLPCGSCHGPDGKGKPEGGVVPSNITWKSLTKNYSKQTTNGRQHKPYDERTLKRAITMGFDPSANELSLAMPRYKMSLEDIAYLVAYLKVIGKEKDAGIGRHSIKIGSLLPAGEEFKAIREGAYSLLYAHFAELNEKGGIYDRKIELSLLTIPENQDQLERTLDEQDLFSFVGGILPNIGQETLQTINEKEFPFVGAIASNPLLGFTANRHIFYLYQGVQEEGKALAKKLVPIGGKQTKTVIIDDGHAAAQLGAKGVASYLKKNGGTSERHSSQAIKQELAKRINTWKEAQVETIFLLDNSSFSLQVLNEIAKQNWQPKIAILKSLMNEAVFQAPASLDGFIYVSTPVWMQNITGELWQYYSYLVSKYQLKTEHRQLQLEMLSAALIFGEALKKAGRNLSRKSLLSALEGLYNFQTGFLPPVSFNANKRIGSTKTFIALLNLKDQQLELIR